MNWLQLQGLFRHFLTGAGTAGITVGALASQLSPAVQAITTIAGGISVLAGIIASVKAPEKKIAG